MNIVERAIPADIAKRLEEADTHPLLAKLYAARGVLEAAELNTSLKHLLGPEGLKGARAGAERLAQCILSQERVCIVADYDCDGATACAVAYLGLKLMGAQFVSYIVPDRVNDGYGLTPLIAQRVHDLGAHVLMTVDNGMASFTGGLDAARRDFARLRELADRLRGNCPEGALMDELSMGMSGDYEVAIEEGATIVRIGSALFEGIVP